MSIDLDHFEKIFIYKALTDSEYFATVCDATNPEFIKDDHKRVIFNLAKDYFEKRDVLPTFTELKTYLTTKQQKESFRSVLLEIQQLDKAFNVDELYANTERFLKERAVYKTMLEVAESVSKREFDTSAILDKFEKTCTIDLTTNAGLDFFNDTDKIIKDLTQEQLVIPSKWKWIDEKMGGGFMQNGRALYIFCGQTNVGKSIVLGNIAQNLVEQGKNVLLITLEMSEMMYAKRMASSLTKIPMRSLKDEAVTLKNNLTEMRSKKNGTLIIKEFPPSTITPKQLSAFIKKLMSKGIKFDAIVLDYINLLTTTIGSNSYEKIKYITEQVRALTYIFNCPIITASQLNKSGYNVATPELTAIGESYGMGATADFISSVYQLEGDAEHGIIRFGIMKNRFGANFGSIAMKIDYSTLSITEDNAIASFTDETEQARSLLKCLSD